MNTPFSTRLGLLAFIITLALIVPPGCRTKRDTLLNDPFSDVDIKSLALTLTDVATGRQSTFTMLPRQGNDPWVFEATLVDSTTGIETKRQFVFTQAELQAFAVRDVGNGQLSIRGSNGEETGATATYAVTAGPGEKEVTYSGSVSRGGREFNYRAVTDPAPLTVVVVVVFGAIICEIVILVTDCNNSQALLQAIDACRERNGKPQVTATTTFGISFSPSFNVGCNTKCEFMCL